METAVEHLASAVEGLPADAANDEVCAVFAVYDRLTAWLSDAVDGVDPAADGAITLPQWLRVQARRSQRDAATLTRRSARVAGCPAVAAAWRDGRLATGQVDAVVATVTDPTAALFAEHAAALVPTLTRLSGRDTETAMRQWATYAAAVVATPEPVTAGRHGFLAAGVDGWGELAGRLDPAGFPVLNAALDAATVSGWGGRTGADPQRATRRRGGGAGPRLSRSHRHHRHHPQEPPRCDRCRHPRRARTARRALG
jgi:Ser/Thr protein kinase RdoA (MazF antagonist)